MGQLNFIDNVYQAPNNLVYVRELRAFVAAPSSAASPPPPPPPPCTISTCADS